LFSPEHGIDLVAAGVMPAVFLAGPAILLSANSASGICAAKIAPVFPSGGTLYLSLSSLRI
jgi:hypothetical protein